MPTLFDELTWRGLVYDATEGVADLMARDTVTAYIGFDPTASSLHVGSLLPVMALARLQRSGHRPIALVGGGTGMIGDPSGKAQERSLLTRDQVEANVAGIRAQLGRFLDFDGSSAARLVDNGEWLARLDLLSFLRDTGKHFTVNYMLQKESVHRRLASEEGISFTEFSYLLLQAYDFLQLHERFGCILQMGGSDQWGNITAGIDLVRKMRAAKVHGLVMPLVTTASGVKFGKTEAGAVWLDPERTSPYAFYQFWLNTDDRDVVRHLKYFTFLDQREIDELEVLTKSSPEQRVAQKRLAEEVTALVHGREALTKAVESSAALFRGDVRALGDEELLEMFASVPSTSVAAREFADGYPLAALVASTGLAASKSEAVRLIRSGGIYVNDERIEDERRRLTLADAVKNWFFVIRRGSKQKHVIKIEGT